jgi:hypothetical protein
MVMDRILDLIYIFERSKIKILSILQKLNEKRKFLRKNQFLTKLIYYTHVFRFKYIIC